MPSNRPNILIITSDQQRKDSASCYNPKVNTPGLQSLADDGVVFDRAYIPHPTCTPSRASILTGQFASKHGAYTIGTALSHDVPMFSKSLYESGYETYFIGKPHFQQLSTPGTFEYSGKAMDENFWREYQNGYYGFENIKLYNGHTKYATTAGMHYRLWLKDKGLSDEDIAQRFNYQPSDKFREHGVWDIEREYHPTVFTSDETINYLENHDDERPFAMWVSFSDPHDPHVTPEPYASMYDPEEVDYKPYIKGEHDNRPDCYNVLYENDYPALSFGDKFGVPSAPSAFVFGDDQYNKEITAIHHGMVKLMDEEIERIIAKLKELGMYDNTMIIFSTDHGDYLGNHGFVYKGFPAFEEVYNVPMIVKNIKSKNAGKTTQALFSHVDIMPTILDVANVDIPEGLDGVSQKDVCLGIAKTNRNSLIIENRPVQKDFYQKMLVTAGYKIVAYMDSEQGELYDMEKDADQYNNLWDNEEFANIKLQMLNKICKYYAPSQEEYTIVGNVQDCLKLLWEQMHAEEPVQERTSYS